MDKKADLLVAASHRDYVNRVVEKTGVAPTAIAVKIGVSPSTLTRLIKEGAGGKGTLRATTLAKLESYSGLPAPTLELPEGERPQQHVLREDAVPYRESENPTLAAIIRAIVGTRKNIDAWTIKTRSLECAGFLPGDTVLVDLGTLPRAGDAACAQVYDWRGGKAETVMRIFEPPYLIAATFDPNLRKPLYIDDDRVIVKGVILPHRLKATP